MVQLSWLIAIASIYAMGGMIYLRLYDYFLIALAVLIYGLIIVQSNIDVRRSIYLLPK